MTDSINGKFVLHSADERSKIYYVFSDGKITAVAKQYCGSDAAIRQQRETFALEYLEITKALNAPRLLREGENYVVMEYVRKTSSPERDILLRDIARFHAEARFAYWNHVQEIFHQPQSTYRDATMFFSKLERILTEGKLEISPPKIRQIQPSHQPLIGLVHGDFHHPHVIRDSQNTHWYIDFELMSVDNILSDVASFIISEESEQDLIAQQYLTNLREESRAHGTPVMLEIQDIRNEVAFRACHGYCLVLESNKPLEYKQRIKEKIETALRWALK